MENRDNFKTDPNGYHSVDAVLKALEASRLNETPVGKGKVPKRLKPPRRKPYESDTRKD